MSLQLGRLIRPGSAPGRENSPRSRPATSLDLTSPFPSGRLSEWKGEERESNESDEWSLDMDPFASKPQPGLRRNRTRGTPSRPATASPRLRSTTMPDLTSRSLFVRSRDKLFPRPTAKDGPPLPSPEPVSTTPTSPVLDIRPRMSVTIDEREDEEEIELGRLRDAAARSLGVAQLSPMNNEFPISSTNTPAYQHARGSYDHNSRNDKEKPFFPHHNAHHDQSDHDSIHNAEDPVPSFPCSLSALSSYTVTASAVSKFISPTPLSALLSTLKGSPRTWKSRHLVLTNIVSTFNSRRAKNLLVKTNILHLFKGSFPDDREVDRLLITEFSRVFVPDDHPDIAGRQCVLKAVGHSAKELRRDSRGALVLKGETTWMFQCPDSQAMKEWLLSIRNIVLNDRFASGTPSQTPEPGLVQSRRRSGLIPLAIPLGDGAHLAGRMTPSEANDGRPSSPSLRSSPRAMKSLFGFLSINPRDLSSPPSSPAVQSMVVSTTVERTQPQSAVGLPRHEGTGYPPAPSIAHRDESAAAHLPPTPRTSTEQTDVSMTLVEKDSRPPSQSARTETPLPHPHAHLLIGVPITPNDERQSFDLFSVPSVRDEKKVRVTNPRVLSLNSPAFEGERESVARFLSSPSHTGNGNSGASINRPLTPNSVSLPPPPRSRRATASGSFPHRPHSPVLRLQGPELGPKGSSGLREAPSTRHSFDLGSDGDGSWSLGDDEFQSPSRLRPQSLGSSSSFGQGTVSFGSIATEPESADAAVNAGHTRTRSSSVSSVGHNRDFTIPSRANSLSKRWTRTEGLPPMHPPPQGPPPDIPISSLSEHGHAADGPAPLASPIQLNSPVSLNGYGDSTPPPRTSSFRPMVPSSSQSIRSYDSMNTTKTHERSMTPSSTATDAYSLPWTIPTPSPYRHPFAAPSSYSFGYDPTNVRDLPPESSPTRSEFGRRPQRLSAIPPPRPAPHGSLPPTPIDAFADPTQSHRPKSAQTYSLSPPNTLNPIPGSPAVFDRRLSVHNRSALLPPPAQPPPPAPLSDDGDRPKIPPSAFRYRSRRMSAPTHVNAQDPQSTFYPDDDDLPNGSPSTKIFTITRRLKRPTTTYDLPNLPLHQPSGSAHSGAGLPRPMTMSTPPALRSLPFPPINHAGFGRRSLEDGTFRNTARIIHANGGTHLHQPSSAVDPQKIRSSA